MNSANHEGAEMAQQATQHSPVYAALREAQAVLRGLTFTDAAITSALAAIYRALDPDEAPCARIEMVVAIHTLASHFENTLYALKDDAEALRKAKGDIAHAMTVAARHNYNGFGCAA